MMQTNQWEAWGVSLVLVVQNILIRQSWMKVGVNRTGEVTHIRNPGTEGCWLAGQACSLDWGTKEKKKEFRTCHTKELAQPVYIYMLSEYRTSLVFKWLKTSLIVEWSGIQAMVWIADKLSGIQMVQITIWITDSYRASEYWIISPLFRLSGIWIADTKLSGIQMVPLFECRVFRSPL